MTIREAKRILVKEDFDGKWSVLISYDDGLGGDLWHTDLNRDDAERLGEQMAQRRNLPCDVLGGDDLFYATDIRLVVLSKTPIPSDLPLEVVLQECDTGEYVGSIPLATARQLTGPEMAAALIMADSDPGFFQLDIEGNRIEEEPDE